MKVGLFGVNNSKSGLGLVCRDIVRWVKPDSMLSIATGHGDERWLGDQMMPIRCLSPDHSAVMRYLDSFQPDAILCVEIPYNNILFEVCRARGVKTAYVPMAEVYNPGLTPDVFVCPTQHCYDKVRESNKLLWRWPCDLAGFDYRQRTGKPRTFVHVLGAGVTNGKRQTNEVVEGFAAVPGDLRLIIYHQVDPLRFYRYGPNLYPDERIEWRGGVEDAPRLYDEADVLLQPEAYAGLGRCAFESMACGVPVITTDAPPMNEVYTGWAVPVAERRKLIAGPFNATRHLVSAGGVAAAVAQAAAAKLDRLSARAQRVALRHNWNAKRAKELRDILEALRNE